VRFGENAESAVGEGVSKAAMQAPVVPLESTPPSLEGREE
jgi:hypothetical protein